MERPGHVRRKVAEGNQDLLIRSNIGEIFEEIAKKRGLDFKCEKSNADYIEFGGGNKTCTFKIWYMAEVLKRRSFLKGAKNGTCFCQRSMIRISTPFSKSSRFS
jgi:hypothetical protein